MANGKKRMSAREKALRAQARTELRTRGVLPPKKKPLNRKRFIREAREEFNGANMGLAGWSYLLQAVGWIMTETRPTLESVGVAKVLKIACLINGFEAEMKAQGRKDYSLDELYERLKPTLEA